MRGGAANPKGITRHDQGVRARCRIGRAGDGLDGPPFIDTYDLRRVGPGERVTTYETGLRISAKARRARPYTELRSSDTIEPLRPITM